MAAAVQAMYRLARTPILGPGSVMLLGAVAVSDDLVAYSATVAIDIIVVWAKWEQLVAALLWLGARFAERVRSDAPVIVVVSPAFIAITWLASST